MASAYELITESKLVSRDIKNGRGHITQKITENRNGLSK